MPAVEIRELLNPDDPTDAASVLRRYSQGAGILVPQGSTAEGRNPPYLFLHRTIAEYLVARHLTRRPRNQDPDMWWQTVWERVDQIRWFNPDWADVISMVGELLSAAEAAELVRRLADEPRDPFNQSFTHAMRIWANRTSRGPVLISPHQARRDPCALVLPVLARLLLQKAKRWVSPCSILRRRSLSDVGAR
jgi:hypothetical protein